MQVKMEPGNINMVQLSPTLQATRSNFTRVHQGKAPPYLEYFLHRGRGQVLVDVLQSEQGARFLKKRNRNMVVLVEDEVPVLPDYAWLTLGQIQQLLSMDNIVNMDSRTVLGCLPFDLGREDQALAGGPFARLLVQSACAETGALHETSDLLHWFTDLKTRYELEVRQIPLNDVEEWQRTADEIRHVDDDFFSIIACRVEADSREVPSWTQPLVKTSRPGLAAFVCKPINGVLHVLLQASVEPGNFDIIELAPTVHCTTGDFRRLPPQQRPPFLDYVLEAAPGQVRLDALLSEEGGRFFREANRNLVVEAGEDFPVEVPQNYIWATLRQLKELVRHSNYLNVECRCLVACLGFLDPQEAGR
jgi:oxidase EvaA